MKDDNITIGSDPEMLIVDRSKVLTVGKEYEAMVSPYTLWLSKRAKLCGDTCSKQNRNSAIGYYPCDYPYVNPFCGQLDRGSAQIGTDGGLFELRPDYGNTPLEHIENIEYLLGRMELDRRYEIFAGTCHFGNAIGGHIHIGMSGISNNMAVADMIMNPPPEHIRLARFLSYYAGLPLRTIEDPIDLYVRGWEFHSGYGRWAGFGYKTYGIEWRMPASWMVSKEIATSALCLTYVVASEFKNNPENLEMRQAQYQQLVKSRNVDSIIKKVERFKIYPLYKKEIEPLFQMITNHQIWPKNDNIMNNWEVDYD